MHGFCCHPHHDSMKDPMKRPCSVTQLRVVEKEEDKLQRQLAMVKFRKQRLKHEINTPRVVRQKPWGPASTPVPIRAHVSYGPGMDYDDDVIEDELDADDVDDPADDNSDDDDDDDDVDDDDDFGNMPPPMKKPMPKSRALPMTKKQSIACKMKEEHATRVRAHCERHAQLKVSDYCKRKWLEVEKLRKIYEYCGEFKRNLPGMCRTPGCLMATHESGRFDHHCCERCSTDHWSETFSKKRAGSEIPHGIKCDKVPFLPLD